MNNASMFITESDMYRLSDHYSFVKPNDRGALDLMNAAAVEVMKDLPDLCIAYGVSDEYRYADLPSVFSQLLTIPAVSSSIPTASFSSDATGEWSFFASILCDPHCKDSFDMAFPPIQETSDHRCLYIHSALHLQVERILPW
jgi:hypothetical protein